MDIRDPLDGGWILGSWCMWLATSSLAFFWSLMCLMDIHQGDEPFDGTVEVMGH